MVCQGTVLGFLERIVLVIDRQGKKVDFEGKAKGTRPERLEEILVQRRRITTVPTDEN